MPPAADARKRMPRWLPWLVFAAVAAVTLFLIYPYFIEYGRTFVHPHRFDEHLKRLVPEHIGFAWHDLVLPFQEFAPGEYRARFLTYYIIMVNLRLKLAFYDIGVPPPAASIAWPLLLLSAWILYRFIVEATRDRLAAALSVLIFVSSTGFLSSFTMLFTAGKSLTILVFVVALRLMQMIDAKAAPGQLLHQVPGTLKYWLGVVVFLGLLLDEVPIFTPLLVFLVYPECFLRWPLRRDDFRSTLATGAFHAAPVVLFLAFVLLIVPLITEHWFGYHFRYLETLLGFGKGAAGAKSLFVGPYGGFTLQTLITNTRTFFGLMFVPSQLAPLVAYPGSGGVLSGQAVNLAQLAILIPLVGGIGFLALGAKGIQGRRFRLVLLATLLFVAFQSMINGRHVPYITAYYYGAPFALFGALVVAFTIAELVRRVRVDRKPLVASLCVLAVGVVVSIQVHNFNQINESYLYIHDERMARPMHAKSIPLAKKGQRVTADELTAIWRAWKRGEMETYIAAHPVSAGAIFLVAELRWLNTLRSRRGPAGQGAAR